MSQASEEKELRAIWDDDSKQTTIDMVKTTYIKENAPRYMAAFTFTRRGGHYTEGYVVKRVCYAALLDLGYPEDMLKLLRQVLFVDTDWSGDRLIDGPSELRDEARAEFEEDCRVYDEHQRELGR